MIPNEVNSTSNLEEHLQALLVEAKKTLENSDKINFYITHLNKLITDITNAALQLGKEKDVDPFVKPLQSRVKNIKAEIQNREEKYQCNLTLHFCVQINDVVGADNLIFSGVDINEVNFRGATPLHYAVRDGKEEMVLMLLSHPNIDKDARTKNGVTIYELASRHPNILEVL